MNRFSLSLLVVMIAPILLSGCLEEETEDTGINALKFRPTVDTRAQQTDRALLLVVVTSQDPNNDGTAPVWKFAYNDITSGVPISSYTFEVDTEGTILENEGEPLSKNAIRNWTIDSDTAIAKAKAEMKGRDMINDANVVEVDYLYLLGETQENKGCQWMIGTRPYEGDTTEVQITVDGRSGEILSISKSKF